MNCPDCTAFGIPKESVRVFAPADLDGEGGFRLSYLLLTEDALIRLTEPKGVRRVDFTDKERVPTPSPDCAVDTFPLARCSGLTVEPQVASVIVTLTFDGAPLRLAAATNACAEPLRELARALERHRRPDAPQGERPHRRPEGGRCPTCGTPFRPGTRICPKCHRRTSIFFRLLGFFKPYAGRTVLAVLCFVGTALVGLATPYLNGTVLYGQVLSGQDALGGLISPDALGPVVALLLLVLTMLVVRVASQFFTYLHSLLVAKTVPFLVKDIKSRIFDAMSRLSLRFFQSRETGGLMTRVLDDAQDVTSLFIDDLPAAMVDGITLAVAMVILLFLNVPLTLLAMALLIIPAGITFILRSKMWTLYGRRHRASRSLNAHISDNITGGRVVRAFGTQENEKARFVGANRRVGKVESDVGDMEATLFVVYSTAATLMRMGVYAMGAWLILSKQGMDYALLLTFTGYVGMMAGPVDTLSRFVRQWAGCMNSAQRIFEIIDAQPDVVEAAQPIPLPHPRGDVALEHVTFAYEPGKPVLKDVSLTAPAGQMLGIVGRSGAGKSTLLNLISRLYDVDEGRITIDGVDIRDLSFADLHGLIAMVSQETYIFMGTVAENIAYARPDATHDEIVAAAIAASAHDFITQLPDGYDTVIGPSGRELSGGQRQRLSIARAILTDPRILILDEATASVDTETEIRIQQALAKLIQGRTTLSVAHRLSTLRDAASLVVLDEGKVVERGTHEELIRQKGTYYRLATIQTRALAKRGTLE